MLNCMAIGYFAAQIFRTESKKSLNRNFLEVENRTLNRISFQMRNRNPNTNRFLFLKEHKILNRTVFPKVWKPNLVLHWLQKKTQAEPTKSEEKNHKMRRFYSRIFLKVVSIFV